MTKQLKARIDERIAYWGQEYRDNDPEGFRLTYLCRIEELRWLKEQLKAEE